MFKITAPGKIFLAGEYGVLSGGSCLLLNVEPRFELRVTEGAGQLSGITKGSPAEKLWQARKTKTAEDLTFVDPYQGQGGFGASSAQFLLTYFWLTDSQTLRTGLFPQLNVRELLSTYQRFAWDGIGAMPSGADLLSQYMGGVCFWGPSTNSLEKLSWPFANLDFIAIPTGNKVATHEHLKTLPSFDSAPLQLIMSQLEKSFREADSNLFVSHFRQWGEALSSQGWVADKTKQLIKKLETDSRVLGIKGCGALGADVLLLLTAPDQRPGLQADLEKILGRTSFTRQHLSTGLQWTNC